MSAAIVRRAIQYAPPKSAINGEKMTTYRGFSTPITSAYANSMKRILVRTADVIIRVSEVPAIQMRCTLVSWKLRITASIQQSVLSDKARRLLWVIASVRRKSTVHSAFFKVRHNPFIPDYRRNRVLGGTCFFTVSLLDRRSDLLVTQIDALRNGSAGSPPRAIPHRRVGRPSRPYALPVDPGLRRGRLLPEGDADFPGRWRAIKTAFSKSSVPTGEPRSP
jgi:putative transposase